MREIQLEEIKKIELAILEYIDEICRKNKIQYFLMYGSLLGAIRHKGMIPWDDDIDIGLERENYNKLIEILKREKNSQYFLMDHSTQKDYFYQYAKLIDTRTIVEERNIKKIENYGLFVDIFAFDKIPNDEKLINKRYKKTKKLSRRIVYNSFKDMERRNNLKNIIARIYKKYCEILGVDYILKKYNQICMEYCDGKCLICNWAVGKRNEEIYLQEYFKKTIDCEFDGLIVKIPEKYDEILKSTYGDYMTLPPIEERTGKHSMKVYWRE